MTDNVERTTNIGSAAKVVGVVPSDILLKETYEEMRWYKEPLDRVAEKSSKLANAIIEKGIRGWYEEENVVFILQQKRVRQYGLGRFEIEWIDVPVARELTTNVVKILHDRYIKDDPERLASLEEERQNLDAYIEKTKDNHSL